MYGTLTHKLHRNRINTGDVIAFSELSNLKWHEKIYPLIIKLFTKSDYYHVGIAWRIGGRLLLIEAISPKIVISILSERGDYTHITTSTLLDEPIEDYMLSKVGQKYSYLSAVMSPFKYLKRDDKWECVELVQAILEKGGLKTEARSVPEYLVQELKQLNINYFRIQSK